MKRNKELDILKGFAIFLMVFDHVGWGGAVHTYIQSFHMPLFFIISGYLWKNGRDVREVAIRRAKTVIIPYFAFSGLYLLLMIIGAFMGMTDRPIVLAIRAVLLFPTDMGNMPLAPALWFLPCFWLCNFLYALLDILLKEKKWVAVISIAVIGMTYSSLSEKMLPFALEPCSIALLFMLIGEEIRKREQVLACWYSKMWCVILVLIFEAILAYINGSVDMRSARYHNCLLYLLNSTLGTVAWWSIIRKTHQLVPSEIVKGCTYLSINSISFLCMNQFFISLFVIAFSNITWSGVIITVARNLIILVLTLILCTTVNEGLSRTKLKVLLGR